MSQLGLPLFVKPSAPPVARAAAPLTSQQAWEAGMVKEYAWDWFAALGIRHWDHPFAQIVWDAEMQPERLVPAKHGGWIRWMLGCAVYCPKAGDPTPRRETYRRHPAVRRALLAGLEMHDGPEGAWALVVPRDAVRHWLTHHT